MIYNMSIVIGNQLLFSNSKLKVERTMELILQKQHEWAEMVPEWGNSVNRGFEETGVNAIPFCFYYRRDLA